MRWTERSWTAESSGSRWPATADRRTPTTAAGAAAEEPPPGDTAAAAGVRGVGDAAVPEAGAALVPAAVPVTAGRGHAPIPALAPSRTRPARRSPSLLPGPNPGLVPEAAHLRRTEIPSPGQGLKANRNLLGKKGLHPKNSSLVCLIVG